MAEAVVSSVVGRLTDLLIDEAQLLLVVKDEIEQVVTELRRMVTFLRDADSRLDDDNVRNLLAGARQLAYDAEHVVETFVLKASFSGKTIQRINKFKFSRKIKEIQRKMPLLFTKFHDFNIKSTLESQELSGSLYGTAGRLKRFCSYTTVEPELFVGFHKDVDKLVGHLVDESDDSYRLISICGMGGLGKTTLAQKIYNHSRVKTYFSGLAWVSISQKWQTKLVLQRILICLVPEKRKEILASDNDKLVEDLLQIQQQRKCLIVLDDIWSADAWDFLKAALKVENSVSKLLLTSRSIDVATYVNPNGYIHRPEFLSQEESWELLQLKALPRGDYLDIRDTKKMEELGRAMLKSCAGLPLAIVVLGGILVTKPSLIEWEKVHRDSMSSIRRGNGLGEDQQREVFEVLRWSYNNLPPQLKPCFLYLGKFKEDELIKAETLYQMWIAEGMVLSSDKREGETMMQVAESYMAELVHKSMVQVKFNRDSLPTKFKSCSLHDLMRDLALSQAKFEDLFEVIDFREENIPHLNPLVGSRLCTRQVVVHFDDAYIGKKANSYFVKKTNQQRYRSMVIFNEFTRIVPPALGSHMANFRHLRVFSLEEVRLHPSSLRGFLYLYTLGRVLGNLVCLRYLSVQNTALCNFPSIRKLVLLQTLKLECSNYTMNFHPWRSASTLSKLRHLQHLYLPSIMIWRKKSKLRFDGLSKLETLENFNSTWCEVTDLPELISLRKLMLKIEGTYREVEEMINYLSMMALSTSSRLLYLDLAIKINDSGLQNCPDILRQLLGDQSYNLQKLTVDGQLPELAHLFEQQQLNGTRIDVSLIRITSLTLEDSLLDQDPMPVLERIPTLVKLLVGGRAFMGKEMVCSATGFPKLAYLEFCYLPNVVKWRVEEGSMPILEHLVIDGCIQLKKLPEGLKFLKSLKRFRLFKMPSAFCNRLRVVNGKQGTEFHKVAHIPHFSISVPDFYLPRNL